MKTYEEYVAQHNNIVNLCVAKNITMPLKTSDIWIGEKLMKDEKITPDNPYFTEWIEELDNSLKDCVDKAILDFSKSLDFAFYRFSLKI